MKKNLLMQYTFLSMIVTVIIAFALSYLLLERIKNQIILVHANFYVALVGEIPHNYSEVIPLIDSEQQKEGGHFVSEEGDDPWKHFRTDLLQYPSVEQVRIFNRDKELIWNNSDSNEEDYKEEPYYLGRMLGQKDFDYHILSEDPYYIIHYYIPLRDGSKILGMVEITDINHDLASNLKNVRKNTIILIGVSGLLFYICLFLLFLRSYLNQKRSIDRLDKSQSLTIRAMSLLAELRDDNTGAHIQRTSLYCRIMANELLKDKRYKDYLSQDYIKDMERSAPLHDIGKVGIPDHILQKPGKLTEEEFKIIKTHPLLGAEVIKRAIESIGFQSYFEIGYQIILHHHENWDGSGYPSGLSGESIPLSARIMSLADVYDALRTERPYKKSFSHEKAMELILLDRGKKFEPRLIDIFERISSDFEKISQQVKD